MNLIPQVINGLEDSLLNYMDSMLGNYISGNSNFVMATIILLALTSIVIVLNTLEYRDIGEM